MDKLLSVLIIIVVFAIIVTIIFNVYDSNTGYSTMDTGVVIDKERALRDDHNSYDLFIKSSSHGEVKASVDEAFYRGTRVGSTVVLDVRIGGVSKQVVNVVTRSFDGVECS